MAGADSATLRRDRSARAPRLVGAMLSIGLPLAGCATPGAHQVQVDLDHIQQQLWAIQKDNAALAEEVARLRETGVPGPAADAASLDLRIERLGEEVASLQSRLDDTDQRITAVVQDLRTTRDALQALVETLPSGAVPPGSLGEDAAGRRIGAGPAVIGGLPQMPAREEEAAPPMALENLYRQGYADYTKGNYSLALQELGEFLQRYPDSPLADDAQYLTGEVHFSQQQYLEAIAAFDHLVREYPGGDKIGPAYLKKGLALLEMNRTADAVVQLQHVIDTYPESEEARIARERLRSLGLRER